MSSTSRHRRMGITPKGCSQPSPAAVGRLRSVWCSSFGADDAGIRQRVAEAVETMWRRSRRLLDGQTAPWRIPGLAWPFDGAGDGGAKGTRTTDPLLALGGGRD